MRKWMKRILGLSVTLFLFAVAGWASLDLYERMYRGDPHYVVMPEGAAGVKPGSSVYYEGMVVGEVTDTEALSQTDPDTRRKANSAYLQKFPLLDDLEGLTPKKRNPHRKAIVRFLLRDASIPVGSSTYATGSAFYVTGQGYITLTNRGLTARASTDPVYIPSDVQYPWLEQYVNMALSVAPFLENLSSFHTRLQNWYHAPQTRRRQRNSVSGRSRLNEIPKSLSTLQTKSDALMGGMDNLGNTIESWNRNMVTTLREIPGRKNMDQSGDEPDSGTKIETVENTVELFGPLSRTSIRSLQHSMDQFNQSIESFNEAFDSADTELFDNGIIH